MAKYGRAALCVVSLRGEKTGALAMQGLIARVRVARRVTRPSAIASEKPKKTSFPTPQTNSAFVSMFVLMSERSSKDSGLRAAAGAIRQSTRTTELAPKYLARLGYQDVDLWMTLAYIRELAPIIIHVNLTKMIPFMDADTHYRSQLRLPEGHHRRNQAEYVAEAGQLRRSKSAVSRFRRSSLAAFWGAGAMALGAGGSRHLMRRVCDDTTSSGANSSGTLVPSALSWTWPRTAEASLRTGALAGDTAQSVRGLYIDPQLAARTCATTCMDKSGTHPCEAQPARSRGTTSGGSCGRDLAVGTGSLGGASRAVWGAGRAELRHA